MISDLLVKILSYNVTEEQTLWIIQEMEAIKEGGYGCQLASSFARTPTVIGREIIRLNEEDGHLLNKQIPFININWWTADKLSRTIFLTALPVDNKKNYLHIVNELVEWADMNELAAFYAALPFLSYPEEWILKVQEGIRSNISTVLEAILYNNPYIADYLEEQQWNQMVCKAVFTDKDINKIVKIDERANAALAQMLIDYVHERHSAKRTVPVQVWRLIDPFFNQSSPHDTVAFYSRLKCAAEVSMV